MNRKHFQYDYPFGGNVSVDFILEEGFHPKVSALQLHTNFETTELPRHATYEWVNDKWALCANYEREINGKPTRVREVMDNELTRPLVEEIDRIINENTPKFGG